MVHFLDLRLEIIIGNVRIFLVDIANAVLCTNLVNTISAISGIFPALVAEARNGGATCDILGIAHQRRRDFNENPCGLDRVWFYTHAGNTRDFSHADEPAYNIPPYVEHIKPSMYAIYRSLSVLTADKSKLTASASKNPKCEVYM